LNRDRFSLEPEINKKLNLSLNQEKYFSYYYGFTKENESGYKGWGRMSSVDPNSTVYKLIYISLNYTCFFASNSCIVDECAILENEK
jgi:hypothetical protein